MQPCIFIEVLVLQSERLVLVLINPLVLFQTTPAGIVTEPQQIAILIGHLSWDADLVAVEIVGLLSAFSVFVGPIADLRQWLIAAWIGVDIGIPAVPNEAGLVFEVV